MILNYDGVPVEFYNTTSYSCMSAGVYFEHDRDEEFWNLTCKGDGSWEEPDWPRCLSSVNCTEPPERPATGTWEWDGDYSYLTSILYTCGPYGQFMSDTEELYPRIWVDCQWNQTWSKPVLDPCKGK